MVIISTIKGAIVIQCRMNRQSSEIPDLCNIKYRKKSYNLLSVQCFILKILIPQTHKSKMLLSKNY